jgi:uncharacterized protein (TIGR02466 family)
MAFDDFTEIKFSKRTYFPTTIFQVDVPEPEELNNKLREMIYAEREADRVGITRSNFTELGGWHSKSDLHKRPEYAEIVNLIDSSSSRMSEAMGYDPKQKLKIGTMWSIINAPGAANRAHVHPGCLWSGVYYIQAPENCGRIEFIEPRTMHLMNQPRYKPNAKRQRDYWTKVRFMPQAGRMLIFPSWLYHGVDPNMSTETGDAANRIIISFNISQVKA